METKNKFCAYYRVSTQKQGASHLGLEAQQKICADYIKSADGELVNEFTDIESGKSRVRKGLLEAVDYCKANKCCLVIAKLDRLARDVEFTFKIMNTGIDIHFCDMPIVNTMILGVFASVAQYERELISTRTKAALDAKKARGETWDRKSRETVHKAQMASRVARTTRANEDATNVFFKKYTEAFEKRNGIVFKYGTDMVWYRKLAEELANLGNKTKTGKEYTASRCRALVERFKRRHGTWQDCYGQVIGYVK